MTRLLYIVRDASGRVVEYAYERDGEEHRVNADEGAHPAEPFAYLLPGGDVPGRVY